MSLFRTPFFGLLLLDSLALQASAAGVVLSSRSAPAGCELDVRPVCCTHCPETAAAVDALAACESAGVGSLCRGTGACSLPAAAANCFGDRSVFLKVGGGGEGFADATAAAAETRNLTTPAVVTTSVSGGALCDEAACSAVSTPEPVSYQGYYSLFSYTPLGYDDNDGYVPYSYSWYFYYGARYVPGSYANFGRSYSYYLDTPAYVYGPNYSYSNGYSYYQHYLHYWRPWYSAYSWYQYYASYDDDDYSYYYHYHHHYYYYNYYFHDYNYPSLSYSYDYSYVLDTYAQHYSSVLPTSYAYDYNGVSECPMSLPVFWLGDGYCDSSLLNIRVCNWDNGDCCPSTCQIGEFYECSQATQSTCLDPDAAPSEYGYYEYDSYGRYYSAGNYWNWYWYGGYIGTYWYGWGNYGAFYYSWYNEPWYFGYYSYNGHALPVVYYNPHDSTPFARLVQLGPHAGPDDAGYIEGMLQVYVHNEWGTVCDDLFSAAEATVACNELGFEFGWHLDPSDVEMENVNLYEPIILTEVDCAGDEPSLRQCDAKRGISAHNCVRSENVALRCAQPMEPEGTVAPHALTLYNFYNDERSSRLISTTPFASGASNVSGILEVRYSGKWGTVCDDGFTDLDARVACFELGFPMGFAAEPWEVGFLEGFDRDPIIMDDVVCDGVEPALSECVARRGTESHNCEATENVAIVCGDWRREIVDGNNGMCCCSYFERDVFADYGFATDGVVGKAYTFVSDGCVGYPESSFDSTLDSFPDRDSCPTSAGAFSYNYVTGTGYKCQWLSHSTQTTTTATTTTSDLSTSAQSTTIADLTELEALPTSTTPPALSTSSTSEADSGSFSNRDRPSRDGSSKDDETMLIVAVVACCAAAAAIITVIIVVVKQGRKQNVQVQPRRAEQSVFQNTQEEDSRDRAWETCASSVRSEAERDPAIPLGFVVGPGSVRRGRTLKNEFAAREEEPVEEYVVRKPASRRPRYGEGGGRARGDTTGDDSLGTDDDVDGSVTLSAGHLHAV